MYRIAERLVLGLLLLALAAPAVAYTVVLVDGSEIVTREAPRIEGERALLVMPNGTNAFLDAAEIDREATRRANEGRENYGTAQVLEGGEIRDLADEAPKVEEPDTLADLIARGEASSHHLAQRPRRQSTSGGTSGQAQNPVATPAEPEAYSDTEMAAALRDGFVTAGASEARVLQGAGPSAPRVEAIADTEAAVFRLLRVAAVLVESEELLDGMELYLVTSQGARAGYFRLDAEQARRLAAEEIDPQRFFVENVIF